MFGEIEYQACSNFLFATQHLGKMNYVILIGEIVHKVMVILRSIEWY